MFVRVSDTPVIIAFGKRLPPGALLLLALLICGCDSAQPSAPPKAPGRPRQRFGQVVERFRDYYRGATVWLTTPIENDGIEHASFRVVVDDVTFQFDPPKGTTKNLSAEVTVRTSAYYQMNTQFLDPVESAKDKAEEELKLSPENASKLEPEEKKDPSKEEWGSDTSRTVKTYDFAYEGGRWVLKTSDLEEGVRLAFEYALKTQ